VKKVILSDPTLRDGSHAVKHQLSASQIAGYCRMADAAGVSIVEVGHGNGIGASSLQLGQAMCSDEQMIVTARTNLHQARLGIHLIPGFATIQRDLAPAIDLGVDVVRVATHCTEADTGCRYIEFARRRATAAYGVLMMSHMASGDELLKQARIMESSGAEHVILMDSAGSFVPREVEDRVGALVAGLNIPVGFHAHNNLGMAIANSLAAVTAGATMIDGTARGFGAGAGNAALELLVAVLGRYEYETGIDLYRALDLADYAAAELMREVPSTSSIGIVSSLAGVFSGFKDPVLRAAAEMDVDPREIIFELGRRKVIAGQEDFIVEVAIELSRKTFECNDAEDRP
jgi:4-hydroxy 2-oxovalerate aldolase